MNSLKLLSVGVFGELRGFQIDNRQLLENLLSEISSLSNDYVPHLYKEMAWGVLEMGIQQLMFLKGKNLYDCRYNQKAARCYLYEDHLEVELDKIMSHITSQMGNATNKTSPDHPFVYQILANGDLLVYMDVRDYEPLVTDTIEEERGDEQDIWLGPGLHSDSLW